MGPVGLVTGRKTTLDVPPPGVGLTTVTETVPGVAMSEARMIACNCEALTKVVGRGLPFQFTTAPGANPVPFRVSAKPGPPGAALAGTDG